MFVLFVFMKIHVVIVHLVNRAQKSCFKVALDLIFLLSKNRRFTPVFEYLFVKSIFLHLQLDVFPGNEGSAVIFFIKTHVLIMHLVTAAK